MAKKDNIYKVSNFNDLPFSFNEEVAEVFEDMVDRSVPGYRSSLKLIENLGKKYFQNSSINAFQHTTFYPNQLSYHLDIDEKEYCPLPDKIICSGPIYMETRSRTIKKHL